MNELISKLSLSDREYMKKVFKFMDSLVIKSQHDADQYETSVSAEAARIYCSALSGKVNIYDFYNDITQDVLISINQTQNKTIFTDKRIALLVNNKAEFVSSLSYTESSAIIDRAIDIQKKYYVETNEYYRMLAGRERLDRSNLVAVEDTYYDEDDDRRVTYISFLQKDISKEIGHFDFYNSLKSNGNLGFTKLVESLKEQGKYYEYMDHLGIYSVDYYTARTAKNFQILAYNPSILNEYDTRKFIISYYTALDYVINVPYIREYSKKYELYDRYMSVIILFQALLIFMNSKADIYIQKRFSTRKDKINFFKQYSLEDIIDVLNDSQLEAIADHIEELISLKGTDKAIIRLLEILKINNIDVCKYLVFKTPIHDRLIYDDLEKETINLKYKFGTEEIQQTLVDGEVVEKKVLVPTNKSDNYDLHMVQIPLEYHGNAAKYLMNKSRLFDLKTIVGDDKYFGETDYETGSNSDSLNESYIKEVERLLKIDDSMTQYYSKYIGVISEIDAMKSIVYSSFVFSSLFNDNDANGANSPILSEAIQNSYYNSSAYGNATVKDLFIALNYVSALRHNMDHVEGETTLKEMTDMVVPIPSADSIKYLMAFNRTPSIDELKEKDILMIKNEGDGIFSVKLSDAIKDYVNELNATLDETSEKYKEEDFLFITQTPETADITSSNQAKLVSSSLSFNIDKYNYIIDKMNKCTSYKEYQILRALYDYNMVYKEYVSTYKGFDTMDDYLKSNNSVLFQYIKDYLNDSVSQRVIVDPATGEIHAQTEDYINACKNLITIFIEDILSAMEIESDIETLIKGAYVDNLSLFKKIMSVVELFKSYTVQFTNANSTYTDNTIKDLFLKVFGYIGSFKGLGHDVSQIIELFHEKNIIGVQRTKYNLPALHRWIDYYTFELERIRTENPDSYQSNSRYIEYTKTLNDIVEYTSELEDMIDKYKSYAIDDKIIVRDNIDASDVQSDLVIENNKVYGSTKIELGMIYDENRKPKDNDMILIPESTIVDPLTGNSVTIPEHYVEDIDTYNIESSGSIEHSVNITDDYRDGRMHLEGDNNILIKHELKED